jgi:hypothetical protein
VRFSAAAQNRWTPEHPGSVSAAEKRWIFPNLPFMMGSDSAKALRIFDRCPSEHGGDSVGQF